MINQIYLHKYTLKLNIKRHLNNYIPKLREKRREDQNSTWPVGTNLVVCALKQGPKEDKRVTLKPHFSAVQS